jgi:hypothetical protein
MSDGRTDTSRILAAIDAVQHAHRDNCAIVRVPTSDAILLTRAYLDMQSRIAELEAKLSYYRDIEFQAPENIPEWIKRSLRSAGIE